MKVEKVNKEVETKIVENYIDRVEYFWGWPIEIIFRHCVAFYTTLFLIPFLFIILISFFPALAIVGFIIIGIIALAYFLYFILVLIYCLVKTDQIILNTFQKEVRHFIGHYLLVVTVCYIVVLIVSLILLLIGISIVASIL